MTDPDGKHRWIVTHICGDCLQSPTGQSILNGAVGIATLRSQDTGRCLFCGHQFADQIAGQQPPKR